MYRILSPSPKTLPYSSIWNIWLWFSIHLLLRYYRPWNAILHQMYVSRTLLTRFTVCTIWYISRTVRYASYTIRFSHGAVRFSYHNTFHVWYDTFLVRYDTFLNTLSIRFVRFLYDMNLISNNRWFYMWLKNKTKNILFTLISKYLELSQV